MYIWFPDHARLAQVVQGVRFKDGLQEEAQRESLPKRSLVYNICKKLTNNHLGGGFYCCRFLNSTVMLLLEITGSAIGEEVCPITLNLARTANFCGSLDKIP